MSAPIPSSRPDASWPLLKSRLEAAKYNTAELLRLPMFFVAIRGLFSLSIGEPGNDINAYDDGFYIVQPQKTGDPIVKTYNGNTDPTRYGWNAHADDYMARLAPGRYKMRRRMHGGRYMAFGQDGSTVTVERIKSDGSVAKVDKGSFGIDLHPGGYNGTSSEGCQTVAREQWPEMEAAILKAVGKNWFDFILIEA